MAPLALVTGAAHRLGKVFALTLARQGFDILLHYHHSLDEALQTKAEIESVGRSATLSPGGSHRPCTNIQLCLPNVEYVEGTCKFCRIHARQEMWTCYSIENWDTSLDLNLRAPFLAGTGSLQKNDRRRAHR